MSVNAVSILILCPLMATVTSLPLFVVVTIPHVVSYSLVIVYSLSNTTFTSTLPSGIVNVLLVTAILLLWLSVTVTERTA